MIIIISCNARFRKYTNVSEKNIIHNPSLEVEVVIDLGTFIQLSYFGI